MRCGIVKFRVLHGRDAAYHATVPDLVLVKCFLSVITEDHFLAQSERQNATRSASHTNAVLMCRETSI